MGERIPGFHEIEGRLRDLEDRDDKTTIVMVVLALTFAFTVWLDLRSHLKEHEEGKAHVD